MSLLAIAIIGSGLAMLTIIINKLLVNEKFVDEAREKMKNLQKELKGLDVKSKEFKEKQEEILNLNMAIMKEQFKPMFITFLPYIIAFYFLPGMFAYSPIDVNSTVHLDAFGVGKLQIDCLGLNQSIEKKFSDDFVVKSENCTAIVNGNEYELNLIGKKNIVNLDVSDIKIKITPPKRIYINLPFSLPLIGDKIGWLGTFIIFSFLTSTIANKLLRKVYLRKWK